MLSLQDGYKHRHKHSGESTLPNILFVHVFLFYCLKHNLQNIYLTLTMFTLKKCLQFAVFNTLTLGFPARITLRNEKLQTWTARGWENEALQKKTFVFNEVLTHSPTPLMFYLFCDASLSQGTPLQGVVTAEKPPVYSIFVIYLFSPFSAPMCSFPSYTVPPFPCMDGLPLTDTPDAPQWYTLYANLLSDVLLTRPYYSTVPQCASLYTISRP